MALFNDGPASTIEEMHQHDTVLLEIAEVENINVTAKLALAQQEIGLELEAILQRARTNVSAMIGAIPLQVANLVATTPIRLWTTYHSLALVYRDAYYSQLTDRYQGKWKEYQTLAQWAREKLLEIGVGLVADPVPQASIPSITLTAATETAGTFYVSITFVNAAGQEGAPSAAKSITTTDGNAVDLLTLNPPDSAAGWNAYVGTSPGTMFLQNLSTLAIGADWVFFPSLAAASGALPGTGQSPDMIRAFPRLLLRG